VFGESLFVANNFDGTIGEYTTSGATVNVSLISGLGSPFGIAVVPEPSSWALLAMGTGVLYAVHRRMKRKGGTNGIACLAEPRALT
jgi:hypothetical protein